MVLIDSARRVNSGSSCLWIGTVASRSPAAILPVVSTAATRGRVNRRASAAATSAAATAAPRPIHAK